MNRNNNFDAMRILAALAVIYGHAHPLAGAVDLYVLGSSVQSLAVKIFFVMSGYLVAKSWLHDPDVFRYLARRGLRIFPGLLLLLGLTVFIAGPLLTKLSIGDYFSHSGVWRYLALNAALYPVYSMADLFSGNTYPHAVNGSLWSLPLEFFMYLSFPAVFTLARVGGGNRLFWVFVLLLCALSLQQLRMGGEVTQVVYGTPVAAGLDVAPYFFLGALYSVSRLERCLSAAGALYLVAVLALLQPVSALMMELMLYLVLPYSILSFCVSATPFLQALGRFGDPSYGIYLYGFLVQQAVYAAAMPGMTPLMNTLTSIPVAVLLAYASWHLVEKRALRLKPGQGMRGRDWLNFSRNSNE